MKLENSQSVAQKLQQRQEQRKNFAEKTCQNGAVTFLALPDRSAK